MIISSKLKKVKSYRIYRNIEIELSNRIIGLSEFRYLSICKIINEVMKPYNIEYTIEYKYDEEYDEIILKLENDFIIKIIKQPSILSI